MLFFDYIISHYGWQGVALAGCILILFLVQLYYHLFVYGRISQFRNKLRKKILESEPPISVVIPLFSEDYRYLEESLPSILGQQYKTTFEVVLVYVGTSNDFYEELARMRLCYPNLTITKIEYNPRFPISVKMALNVGIKSAHNEHVIISTTSAQPATEQWLAMMGKAFTRGNIVLGYTAIEPASGLKNYLMRMSRLQMSMYWMSQSVSHNTYRGSRHNIGFTKTLYFGNKGFSHLNMNIGEEDLLAAVAPTLKNKLMKYDGTSTYTSIDDSELKCVAGLAGAESYEVVFQLADGVDATNWYSFDGANYAPVADVNAELAKVEPAKIWKDGMTYYYADVKHLGSAGTAGEYGVIRNHSYKVAINGVKGWGTPVYDPEFRVVPVKPTDKETYISAEINVLSWRVVSYDVTLE
jgi:glycosyltransferase involved in cell wall biosynthesis